MLEIIPSLHLRREGVAEMLHMDTLSLVLLGCAVLPAELLILLNILGGIQGLGWHFPFTHGHGHGLHAGHHAGVGHGHHTPFGGINLNAILSWLFGFGLSGTVYRQGAHIWAPLALVLAVMFATLASTLTNVVLRRLFAREVGRLGYDSSELPGRFGLVSIAIRAGGVGEVIFSGTNDALRSLGARSADGLAVERGTEVVILDECDGIAVVQTWDRLVA